MTVVEGDEGGAPGGVGQVDEAQQSLGHDLVGGTGRCGGGGVSHAAHASLSLVPVQAGFSQMTVPPMPSPMHMVVRP